MHFSTYDNIIISQVFELNKSKSHFISHYRKIVLFEIREA